MISNIEKINYECSLEQYLRLVDIFSELSKIGEFIKIKIVKDKVMLYSLSAKNIKSPIHAFKGVIVDIQEIFTIKEDVPEKGLDFIFTSNKLLLKNLSIYDISEKKTDKLKGKIVGHIKYNKNLKTANEFSITYSKLKFNFISGDEYVIKDISMDMVKQFSKNSVDFVFDITPEQFKSIKKVSQNYTVDEIISFIIKDDKISVGNSKWNLELGQLNYNDTYININKKYFNSIKLLDDDNIQIKVYDKYILIDNNESVFLISLELTNL